MSLRDIVASVGTINNLWRLLAAIGVGMAVLAANLNVPKRVDALSEQMQQHAAQQEITNARLRTLICIQAKEKPSTQCILEFNK